MEESEKTSLDSNTSYIKDLDKKRKVVQDINVSNTKNS